LQLIIQLQMELQQTKTVYISWDLKINMKLL